MPDHEKCEHVSVQLASLPSDALCCLVHSCDVDSVARLARVCKSLRRITEAKEVWQRLFGALSLRWRPVGWAIEEDSVGLPCSWKAAVVDGLSNERARPHSGATPKLSRVHVCANQYSLDDALQIAMDGDEILLHRGMYQCTSSVGMSLSIRGVGNREDIVLRQEGSWACFLAHSGNLLVSNVTVRSTQEAVCAIVVSGNANLRMCCCNIISESGGGAVVAESEAHAHLISCDIFSRNTCFTGAGKLQNCRMMSTEQSASGECRSVVNLHGAGCEVTNCIIVGHGCRTGIVAPSNFPSVINQCNIQAGTYGVSVRGSTKDVTSTKCTLNDCTLHTCTRAGLHVKGNARVDVHQCILTENGAGIYVEQWPRPSLKGCMLVDGLKKRQGEVSIDGCEIRNNGGAGLEAISKDMIMYTWHRQGNLTLSQR